MKITLELLRLWGVCDGGYEWMADSYPEGGELQEVLGKLNKEGRYLWASWLLKKAGALMAGAPQLLLEAAVLVGLLDMFEKHTQWEGAPSLNEQVGEIRKAIKAAEWNEHEPR